MNYEQYDHHGCKVWVDSDLKGTHRDNCLCQKCGKFNPGEEDNCSKAQELYELCVKNNMATPVYECPNFILARYIYLICPVRHCDEATLADMTAYVEGLEANGNFVHFPPRDVDQDGSETSICEAHRTAMVGADEVHVWWDPDSTGSHFDFGMAYMLRWFNSNIKFVYVNGGPVTPHKSFGNLLQKLSDG